MAYQTFYTSRTEVKAPMSSIRYTCEKDKEEKFSEQELTCFMEGQLEAQIFYLETPPNAKERAENIARISLKLQKEKLKEKI